jgi:4'-phosphopantetheinyl transferase
LATTTRVWWARPSDASAELVRLLDDDERRRLRAYRRREDRARFLVGCALAKTVAGRAVGADPARIRFDRSCPACGEAHGKPRLPGATVELSVSHSGELVGVALSAVAPVGLDVELVRDAEVVETALTPHEHAAVAAAEDPGRAFAVCWTRKEAAAKAIGAGLRLDPREVAVSSPFEPPRLLSWPAAVPADEVALVDLEARARHVAALAVVGEAAGVVELDGSRLLRALP